MTATTFTLKDRGETLEVQRGGEVIRIDVTWSLHARVFADPVLRSDRRSIPEPERTQILREAVAFLRTQTHSPIEVVGEPSLGDRVTYEPEQLASLTTVGNWIERNDAIHELQHSDRTVAVRAWYAAIRDDPELVCVSSAFGLLLQCAGIDSWQHRPILFVLSGSPPGSPERTAALAELRALLAAESPNTLALVE
jgi:hypothetical protein